MKLLLDTHALLWWLEDSSELSAAARAEISEPRNLVYVSAVSLWEIVIKRSLGKLDMPDDWVDSVREEPFRRLEVTWEHAIHLGTLPPFHRDPFDRLLISQAAVEGLVLVTRDGVCESYGIATLKA